MNQILIFDGPDFNDKCQCHLNDRSEQKLWILPVPQVKPPGCRDKPSGQAHFLMLPGPGRQMWEQPPLPLVQALDPVTDQSKLSDNTGNTIANH